MAICEAEVNVEGDIIVNDPLQLRIAGLCIAITEAKKLSVGGDFHRERVQALADLVAADSDALIRLKSLNGGA